jgi:hypothetical protein
MDGHHTQASIWRMHACMLSHCVYHIIRLLQNSTCQQSPARASRHRHMPRTYSFSHHFLFSSLSLLSPPAPPPPHLMFLPSSRAYPPSLHRAPTVCRWRGVVFLTRLCVHAADGFLHGELFDRGLRGKRWWWGILSTVGIASALCFVRGFGARKHAAQRASKVRFPHGPKAFACPQV